MTTSITANILLDVPDWLLVIAILALLGVRTGRGFGRGFILGGLWTIRRRRNTRQYTRRN